jgi:hypothetical protein
MKELKTLKDLNFYGCYAKDIKDLLKQEAIKWVKEIQANTTQDFSNLYLIKWIKKFFNLTEEDLEEKE